MNKLKSLVTREPALLIGLVLAALGLASSFGLVVTEEQVAAVVAFVGAVLALAGALVTRETVTPTAAPTVPSGTEIRVKDRVTGEIGEGVVTVAPPAHGGGGVAVAEWPVEVVESLEEVERGKVPPGQVVVATWANISGDPKAAIWIICPRCGTLGHCPRRGSRNSERASWEIAEDDGLTMRPSVLCNSTVAVGPSGEREELGRECGGHYWLTGGVLADV